MSHTLMFLAGAYIGAGFVRRLECHGGCDREAPMPLEEWDATPYIAETK